MSLDPGLAASVACLLEATARKPGNVHRFQDFDNLSYVEFALSAAAIAAPMAKAPLQPLGRTILEAVQATRQVVTTNTNLGMILLIAPLASVKDFKELNRFLAGTTVADAEFVYEAIRIAQPGGLGVASEQDVSDKPTVTLTEAMRIAAHRDLVARQYACGFSDVFEIGLPVLETSVSQGLSLETAIIKTHLTLISELPDSLIIRKLGSSLSAEATRKARQVLASGWPANLEAFDEFDGWLRADGNRRNPGATADLVAAALFIALRVGTIIPSSGFTHPAGPLR